ncbi:hypothetical protein Daus18300_011865 [Diaporthe australafricana]|uniref:Uncharacterized protein n=1 Tax=Diaporthe australafricana TaxID=127596 RepID=A0ABR3W594_9PEZI
MLAWLYYLFHLANNGESVCNLGLIMVLFIRFAEEMRQCGLLRDETRKPVKLWSRDRARLFDFDIYIRGYARFAGIRFDKLDGLEVLPYVPKIDDEVRKDIFRVIRPDDHVCANSYIRDRFDLTTWSIIERERFSPRGEDPLKKEDFEALLSGKTMQVM